MKQNIRLGILLLALVIGLLVIFVVVTEVEAPTIVGELHTRLAGQGVPVKSVKISSQLPLEIEVLVQSQSTGDLASPDDPLYIGAVQREIAGARARGNKIERVQIIVENLDGKEIQHADLSVDPALDEAEVAPSKVGDEAVKNTILSQKLFGRLTLNELEIVPTPEGGQLIRLKLTAAELDDLNRVLPGLTNRLSATIQEMRQAQGAEIPGFSLEVFNRNGDPLLKYSNVYEVGREKATWWMATEVSQDWFSHPPLPTPNP